MASVTTSSITQPTTPLTATESTIPQGATRRGSTVSSVMWALASYPVKVHCAWSRPTRKA
jgi:hypothetical protein